MKKILPFVNLILIGILLFILLYPKIQATKILDVKLLYEENILSLPLWVAQEKGIFDSLNLNVTLEKVIKEGEEVDYVAKGASQAGSGISWPVFIYKIAGRPEAYRVLISANSGVGNPYYALFASKKSRIRRLKDIEGKRIGYLMGTRDNEILKYLFNEEGVTTKTLTFIPLTVSQMDSAFIKGQVDVLLAVEPARSSLLNRGEEILLEDAFLEKRILSTLPLGVTFTSIVNLHLEKEEVKRTVKALNLAVDYIREHPEEVQTIAKNYLSMDIDEENGFNVPEFKKYNEIEFARPTRLRDFLKKADILLFDVNLREIQLRPADIH